MKSLVVYFSKGGNTRYVGQQIAEALGADVEEIVEEGVNRQGLIGWLLAGRDGMMKKKVKIKKPSVDAAAYDLVFIGSPVWAFNLAPAIRSYLNENKIVGKKLALFCTKVMTTTRTAGMTKSTNSPTQSRLKSKSSLWMVARKRNINPSTPCRLNAGTVLPGRGIGAWR